MSTNIPTLLVADTDFYVVVEDPDDTEEVKPTPKERSRRRKRSPPEAAHRPRKGKQKALSSEMEIFISGSEESDGNGDYAGRVTEVCNIVVKLTVSLTFPRPRMTI